MKVFEARQTWLCRLYQESLPPEDTHESDPALSE